MSGSRLVDSDPGVRVHVPMIFKRRSGRKEIIMPDGHRTGEQSGSNHNEALVVAISRAHRWKKLLDEGKYRSVAEMARSLKVNRYCMARMLRLTLLAPGIIEVILDGREPEGMSLEMLRRPMSMLWKEQREMPMDLASTHQTA